MNKKIGIIGAGGHAREVSVQICGSDRDIDMFIDDEYYSKNLPPNILKLSDLDVDCYNVLVCVGNCKDREKIVNSLPKNISFLTFIHPSAQIFGKNIVIGDGSFIGPNCILTDNIKIGKHSILNRGCQIGHDNNIGDYLSMMPNSVLSGNCNIGDRFYIGTNSSVKEKLNICNDVTIGLNSGVVKHIIENGVYVGCPVKKMKLK